MPETPTLLTKEQCPQSSDDRAEMEAFDFRARADRALFPLTCCRPDIVLTMMMVLQFTHNPDVPHTRAILKRVMRHVAHYCGKPPLIHGSRYYMTTLGAAFDCDDANIPEHCRSLKYVLYFPGQHFASADSKLIIDQAAPFGWSTCTQQWTLLVAENSCVSELYAIAVALRKIKCFRPFLSELASRVEALRGLEQTGATPILSDCESAVIIAEGPHPVRYKGTKHLEHHYFSVQQAVLLGIAEMRRCASQLNVADIGCTFKDMGNFLQQRLVLMQNEFLPPSRAFKVEHQAKRGLE